MATLLLAVAEMETPPGQDPLTEPDQDWKNNTKAQIEESLQQQVDAAREHRDQQLRLHVTDKEKTRMIADEFEQAMATMRRVASEQFAHALQRERQMRRWTSGKVVDPNWNAVLVAEQQAILDKLKRGDSPSESAGGQNGAAEDGVPSTGDRRYDQSAPARRDSQYGSSSSRVPYGHPQETHPIPPANARRGSYGYAAGIDLYSFEEEDAGIPSYSTEAQTGRASVSRQRSTSSLSRRPDHWRSSANTPDISATSRTFQHAAYTVESPVAPTRRDSVTSANGRSLSRASSLRSVDRPRVEADTYQQPSKSGIAASRDQQSASLLSRTREKQPAALIPQSTPQRTYVTDFRPQLSMPVPPSVPLTWSPSEGPFYSPASVSSVQAYGVDVEERAGIPIRGMSSSRQSASPQGSPDFPRFQAGSLGGHRPVANRTSFTRDSDVRQPQLSPVSKLLPGSQGSSSPMRPLQTQRSFTIDQSSPGARGWQGPQVSAKHTRRDSGGSVSLRSQSSRQDLYSRVDPDSLGGRRRLQDLQEQSFDSDSDSDFGSPDLELAEQREEIEAERREADARVQAEEAKRIEAENRRKEAEGKRKEAEAKRKEAESRRKDAEARLKLAEQRQRELEAQQQQEAAKLHDSEVSRRAEELRRKEEEALRKEEEARRIEAEARLKEEEARRIEAELWRQQEQVRRKEEEARRKAEEAKRREEEARRRVEEAKRKEEEIKRKEEEAKRKEEEALRKQEEARRKQEEAKRKEEEARRKQEEALRKEAELKLKEAEATKLEVEALRLAEEIRLKEEEIRRKEEELRRREEQLALREQEAFLKEQGGDDFLREQQEALRQLEERKRWQETTAARMREDTFGERKRQEAAAAEDRRRQDSIGERQRQESTGSTSGSYRPPPPTTPQPPPHSWQHSGPPPSSPMPVPGRHNPSSSTDRSSTASSSSWVSSSPSGYSSSGRSSGTSNTSHTTQSSTSTRASTTPTGTSSAKPGPSGPTHAGPAPVPPASAKPMPFPSTADIPVHEEEEWRRRQEERARRQQEQFKRMQEMQEENKQWKSSKPMSKEDVVRLFEQHERRWADLSSMDVLTWDTFPWPMLKKPAEPDDLTTLAIKAYVLSPHSPSEKSNRDRIKEHIRRWHPDRFETKLLPKVRTEDQEKVKQAAGLVARNLNEILTRQSSAPDPFA